MSIFALLERKTLQLLKNMYPKPVRELLVEPPMACDDIDNQVNLPGVTSEEKTTMIRTLTTSAAAICLMAGSAIAAPTMMSDAQMESQVAGETIFVETRSGKTVWTVTDLDAGQGFNNGGNGNTARTAPGLLKAFGAGGLTLRVVE